MSGPWEKYQAPGESEQASQGAPAPWERYAAEGIEKTSIPESAYRGASQGATLGFQDELAGAANAVTSGGLAERLPSFAKTALLATPLGATMAGSKLGELLSGNTTKAKIGSDYKSARDEERMRNAAAKEDRPWSYGLSEFAGGIAPSLLVPGAKALTIPKMAGSGALIGGIMGAGASEGENARAVLQDAWRSAEMGALFGGGLGLAGKGFSAAAPYAASGAKKIGDLAGRAAGSTAKTAITVLLGPKREAIDAYLKRAPQINAAKSIEEIKSAVDGVMGGFLDLVDSAKLSKAEAKEGLRLIEQHVRDATKEANFSFSIKRADVKDQLRAARAALDSAFEGEKAKLTSIKSPVQMSDDIQTSIKELKDQVATGSKQAYSILEKSNIQVDTVPIFQEMRSLLASMGPALTDSGRAGVSKIGALTESLYNLPTKISGPQAKAFIQELDQAIDYGTRTGEFTGEVSQALSKVRRSFDAQIKGLPEYQEKMAEVASKTQLLKAASDRLGDPRAAISRLNSIAGRTAGEDRALLERLGNTTGRDFKTAIDQFSDAQATLKNPRAMEQVRRGLPEFKTLAATESRAGKLSRADVKDQFVEGALSRQGLREKLAEAQHRLGGAEDGLLTANAKLEPVKSLSPGRTQAIIENLLKDPKLQNVESREAMRRLSALSDTDFIQLIQDLRTQRAFSGEYRNGSRNVVLGGIVGFVTGGLPGLGGGAALGSAVDRFGPKAAKAILDGYLKVSRAPSAKAIEALNIPQLAKNFLQKELLGTGRQAVTSGAAKQVSGESRHAEASLERRLQELRKKSSIKNDAG